MMRLVRKHIRKHRPASRPHRCPTPPVEFRYSPFRSASQSILEHPQTLLRALFVGRSSLLHRAPGRIERRRTLQMRCRVPYPHQPAVMQMRKQRSNCPPAPRLPGRLSPPSPRVKMRQQMLIHQIVDGVSLNQNRGKFCFRSGSGVQTHTRFHKQSPFHFVILSGAFVRAKRRQMRSRRIPTRSHRPERREAFSRRARGR